MNKIILIFLAVLFVYSQNKISGSITLESTFTDYDEKSRLWSNADETSIQNDSNLTDANFSLDKYSTSYLVPGFKQNMSLSLFTFTDKYKASLFSRIQYSDWTKPDRMKHIDRVTLNIRFGQNQFVLGDHYISGNEFSIDQRRIRGAYVNIPVNNNSSVYSNEIIAFGGLIEYENLVGDPVVGRYQSYYRVNRYDRSLFGFQLKNYLFDKNLELNFSYMSGKDAAEGEIDTLTIDPLKNSVLSAIMKANLYEKQVYVNLGYFQSKTDTIYVTNTSDKESSSSYQFGIGIDNSLIKFEINKYRVEPEYYTFGQPYLITDRDGFTVKNRINFTPRTIFTANFDIYETNLDDSETAFALSSAELKANLKIPVTKESSVSFSYDRISDNSKNNDSAISSGDFFLKRSSNSLDLQFSHNFSNYNVNFFAGNTNTEDNGQYGLDSLDQPIKGISSDRFYIGLSGSYNMGSQFRLLTSLTYNFLEQITVDKTDIINLQFNANYQAIPGVLSFNTVLNTTISGNDLNSRLLTSSQSVSDIRYRLFSAVNEYQQNYGELSTEYFLDYKIRFKLSLRYDQKTYQYFKRSQSDIDLLKSSAINLRNPNFFNQKENYEALSIKLGLSYLL